MPYPDKINALVDIAGTSTLAAVGHAARHNDLNDAFDELAVVLTVPAANTLALAPGGTERMRITSAGNVGIGTTTPGIALDVVGSIRATTPSGTSPAIRLVQTGNQEWRFSIPAGSSNLSLNDSTAERMRIDTNGLITGTGTSLGAWTAYTPTLSGTGWAIGNGTATGAYCQIGKIVIFRAKLAFGSTSTFGTGTAIVSLPLGLSSGHQGQNSQFHVSYLDLSAGAFYSGVTRTQTATTVSLQSLGTNGVHNAVTSTVPFTWASTDEITVNGTYEIA